METIKIHSAVYERLKANGAFDVTGNATGDGTVTVLLGRRVVVDDGMTESLQTVSEVFGWC